MKGHWAFIKSDKARAYSDEFHKQCATISPMFECDLYVEIDIWYASRRPDLDETLILDLLQGHVYLNDRQVKSRRCRWGIDKKCPRVSIHIRPVKLGDYAGE